MQGTDDDGRQLDQREFEETRRALRWLATCQMGWYRNRGGRYRQELLDILGDFTKQGLPAEHGIELHVAPDGQRWWAGRQTITGWYFAIGAAGPPRTNGSTTVQLRPAGSRVSTPTGATGHSPSTRARTGRRQREGSPQLRS